MLRRLRTAPAGMSRGDRTLRIASGVGGSVAVIAGLVEVLALLEILSHPGPLDALDRREGDGVTRATLALVGLSLAGVAVVWRRPAVACVVFFVAANLGFVALGLGWGVAGVALLVASVLALAAVRDPFAEERRRERAQRRRDG